MTGFEMGEFAHIANLPKAHKPEVVRAAYDTKQTVIWSDAPRLDADHDHDIEIYGSIWSAEDSLSAFWDRYVEIVQELEARKK